MVDFLIVLALAVAILATAYVLTMLFWRPERNVERAMLGHWFRSLIRLYEPESLVRISQRGSSHEFTLRRRAGQGSQCWVVLTCPSSSRAMLRLAPLRDWIETEPRLLVFRDSFGPASSRRDSRPEDTNGRLEVQVSIPDIWSSDAADVVLGIANRALDLLGVGPGARFDLEFLGEHSMDRALEARRRQRDGSLEEW